MVMRLFSVFDSAVSAYMRPFVSDHKANAMRSFSQLVNDKSDPSNMVSTYPDQFVLFEIGQFDDKTGVISNHPTPLSLGNGAEFIRTAA